MRFYPGVNVVTGSNGSGKSSLLEAISFALYGERALPYELSAAIHRGATHAKVRLTFTGLDGKEYTVERVLRLRGREGTEAKTVSDSAASKFYHPDGNSSIGTRKLDEEVLEHFGVPARAFLDALSIRQGELRRIVELRGVERAQYLDRLIGISNLEECYARASGLQSWSELNLTGAEMKQKSLQEETRALPEIEASLDVANEQAAEIRSLLESRRTELTQVVRDVEGLQALRVELANIGSELKPLDASLLALNRFLDESREDLGRLVEAERERRLIELELAAKPGLEERRALLQERRQSLLASFRNPESIRRDLEAAESRLKDVSEQVERLPSKLTELDLAVAEAEQLEADYARYPEVSRSYEQLSARCAELRAETGNLQLTLRNLAENIERNCPTCLQPITATYAKEVSAQLNEKTRLLNMELSSLDERRSATRREMETLDEKSLTLRKTAVKAEALRSIVEALKRSMEEATELDRRAAELQTALQTALHDEKELRATEREAEMLAQKLAELQRNLGRLDDLNERLAEKPALEEKTKRLSEELKELELRSSALRLEESRLRGLFRQAELNVLTGRQEELNREVVSLAEELGTIQGRASELAGRIKELRGKENALALSRSEVEKWHRVVDLALQVRASFRGSQSTLRRQFIDSINVEAEQIFLDVRRKRRLDGLILEPDYGIYVLEGGHRYPISAYSGGERTLAAIVLRTAVAKTVLGEVPLLIYDEPTEYLDPDHRDSLVNWLKDYGEVRQVIVVSNLTDFEDVAHNVIRASMGEDGISTVS